MQNRLFSHVKRLLGGNRATAFDDLRSYRLSVYTAELDKPEHTFPDDEADRIDIHAFGRDFASGDATDEGYVLLTDGMSNRRMDVSVSDSDEAVKRRAELMWYVREPTQEILANFRWLAKLPFRYTKRQISFTTLGQARKIKRTIRYFSRRYLK